MPRIPLTGGTYQARDPVANNQLCINLFPENNPPENQPPAPVTHYRTPGLTLLSNCPTPGPGRGLWAASNGVLYAVVGTNLYSISPTWAWTFLGTLGASFPNVVTGATWTLGGLELTVTSATNIVEGMNVTGAGIPADTQVASVNGTDIVITNATTTEQDSPENLTFSLPSPLPPYTSLGTTPVGMTDNGLQLVIVDGSAYGWYLTLANNQFSSIYDTAFLGSTWVDYVDTFFLFNEPNEPTFYSSLSLSINFDPLYFADKEGFSDYLQRVMVNRREVWLCGQRTMENWYNAGATDFPFAIMPGTFIQHGTVAPYSLGTIDSSIFFLTQDLQGQSMVFMAQNYTAQRVSSHGVEYIWRNYATVSDAVGWTYNAYGHSFYVVNFPTADATWVFDIATRQWHQWSSDLPAGTLHRHRGQAQVQAYGKNVIIDWETGALSYLDLTNATENGNTIQRLRSFQHLVGNGNRQIHWELVADVATDSLTSGAATLTISWSDDRGQTFMTPAEITIQASPTSGQWQQAWITQLGETRDRIYQFEWTDPNISAIQGMFLEVENCT